MRRVRDRPEVCQVSASRLDECYHLLTDTAPISSGTTKVPAHAAVQRAEPSLAESLTKIVPCFSTALSTAVLKTLGNEFKQQKRAALRAALKDFSPATSRRLLPVTSDQYRSWNGRSAHHPDLPTPPSTGSSCWPPDLRA